MRGPDELSKMLQTSKGSFFDEGQVRLLLHPQAHVRVEALKKIGKHQYRDAILAVKELLKDNAPQVRVQAAVTLIQLGEQEVFGQVISALFHQDKRVIVGAALTLGHLEDQRAVPSLIEAFKTNELDVGAAVAWALGQCRGKQALPWLLAAVDHDFVRANACEALGKIGACEAAPSLLGVLKKAPTEEIKAYAAKALGMLDFSPHQNHYQEVVLELQNLLQEPSRKVRLCAALSLHMLEEKWLGVGSRYV